MRRKMRTKKPNRHKTKLGLPDLEHVKSAVLVSLRSPESQRSGDYPAGFKWRSELTDGDVRELQKKGGKIVIMRPDYQVSDLEDARKQCQSPTVK
jgi:hypothetical protein